MDFPLKGLKYIGLAHTFVFAFVVAEVVVVLRPSPFLDTLFGGLVQAGYFPFESYIMSVQGPPLTWNTTGN